MKVSTLSHVLFALLLVSAPFGCAQQAARSSNSQAAVASSQKTVKLLAIGNSFSGDATAYLRDLVEAGGNTLVSGHASIGGCPLDRHVRHAMAHEKDPEDPQGRPYTVGGKKVSLKQLLLSEEWEYVTIQQASIKSFDIETYRPYAQQLVDYVHEYAPNARVVFHETWAYRADDPMFKSGKVTRQQMYDRLHDAYSTIADEIHAAGMIPVGTAYENALRDPRWAFKAPENVDPSAYTYPALPPQANSLHVGYRWPASTTRPSTQPAKLAYDGHHSSPLGRYLGACTWYEFFFGDVRGNRALLNGITREQALILQDIAHNTVQQGAKPRGGFAQARAVTDGSPAPRQASSRPPAPR
jgi:hypothetical protein